MSPETSYQESDSIRCQRIRAAWLVTGVSEPIRGGCVLVRDGRVVEVESKCAGTVDIDLADSILLPGLINGHTHLEFSGLEQPLTAEAGFVEWVRKVIAYRQSRWGNLPSQEQLVVRRQDLQRGLEESWRSGTVAIADIATSPYPLSDLLAASSMCPVVCWGLGEVLGWTEERQREMCEAYESMSAEAQDFAGTPSIDGNGSKVGIENVDYRWGISPHAPYSTSPRVIQWCIERSRNERRLLAMHLGETQQEMEWLSDRTGLFAELLERMGVGKVPVLPQWKSSRDYLVQLSRAWRAFIVHANYLPTEDWEVLVNNRGHMSVVYCPRTHQHFGHTTYPLKAFRDAGVRVLVGTDSRASNPDLSVWRELQTIAESGSGLSSGEILALGTTEAAEGLGVKSDLGTIAAGKTGRFAVAKIVDSGALNVSVDRFWERLWDSRDVALPQVFGL